jgi:hypothetical protein
MKWGLLAGLILLPAVATHAQQVADSAFDPAIDRPEHEPGGGATIVIDAAHLNFHTADGGYAPFAKLLRLDGYRIDENHEPFAPAALARVDVLVVANAMHKQSEADWAPLPTLPAFTAAEVADVEKWVRGGGALLLIADHMPLAGHAETLAAAFGVRFHNGFAFDGSRSGQVTFRRSDGTLRPGLITDGRRDAERVDSVTSFTGQAFRLDPSVDAEPLLVLPDGYELWLPEVAFEFAENTPRISAAHLLQGAILHHGAGRVAVFGEAAMFTAQLGGPDKRPFGMNSPEAPENYRFALNVVRWLAGTLK